MNENNLRRCFVAFNPAAGQGNALTLAQDIENHFRLAGWACEFYQTTGQKSDAETMQSAIDRGVAVFVAAGGDGTISTVAGGIAGTNAMLAVLPLGTGNVFAREIGVPLTLSGALNLITGEHTTRWLDAMRVEKRVYLLNVSVGISSFTMSDTKRPEKRILGRIAYGWRGFLRLLGAQPYRFKLTIDGKKFRVRAADVLIPNASTIGVAHLKWGEHIHADDGHVDVCVIRARTWFDFVRLGWRMLLGQQKNDPAFRSFPASRQVVVQTRHPLPVQGDGEMIGYTPLVVEVLPRAVQVIAPVAMPTVRLPILGLPVR